MMELRGGVRRRAGRYRSFGLDDQLTEHCNGEVAKRLSS
jgi:hypothetical protein